MNALAPEGAMVLVPATVAVQLAMLLAGLQGVVRRGGLPALDIEISVAAATRGIIGGEEAAAWLMLNEMVLANGVLGVSDGQA